MPSPIIRTDKPKGHVEIPTQKQSIKNLQAISALSKWVSQLDPTLLQSKKETPLVTERTLILDPNEIKQVEIDQLFVQQNRITSQNIAPKSIDRTRVLSTVDMNVVQYLIPIVELGQQINNQLEGPVPDVGAIAELYLTLKDKISNINPEIRDLSKNQLIRDLKEQMDQLNNIYNFEGRKSDPILELIDNLSRKTDWSSKESIDKLYTSLKQELQKLPDNPKTKIQIKLLQSVLFNKHSSLGNNSPYHLTVDKGVIFDMLKTFNEDKFDQPFFDQILNQIDTLFANSDTAFNDLISAKLYVIRNLIAASISMQKEIVDQKPLKEYLLRSIREISNPQIQDQFISELANLDLDEHECTSILRIMQSEVYQQSTADRQALGSIYLKLKELNPNSPLLVQDKVNLDQLNTKLLSLSHQEMAALILNPSPELQALAYKILNPVTYD
ncbi:MAG: hypothetical protein ACRCXZ_01720 [Patescibacteria group bacterium]